MLTKFKKIVPITAVFIGLLFFVFFFINQKKTIEVNKTDFFFDTYVTITIYGPNAKKQELHSILDDCIRQCQDYELKFSKTMAESEISRINHAKGEWTMVSDETIALLYTALEYCEYTDGLLDITIAPVKDLWDFRKGNEAFVPEDAALLEALSHVNYKMIEINGNRVRLQDPEASIDLGFIAKGYIADQIKAHLIQKNITSALINLGGNIQTIGLKPDGSPFHIGIQKPFAKLGSYELVVEAGQKPDTYTSIVTSGIYERYFEKNRKIYHHIIDAKTGYPAKTKLNSVTILTNSSVHADALSTACMLLGLERSLSMILDIDEVDAIFITEENEIIDTRKGNP